MGRIVGSLGAIEGFVVGINLGDLVGSVEGPPVGELVGTILDGLAVGDMDGLLGYSDGLLVAGCPRATAMIT